MDICDRDLLLAASRMGLMALLSDEHPLARREDRQGRNAAKPPRRIDARVRSEL